MSGILQTHLVVAPAAGGSTPTVKTAWKNSASTTSVAVTVAPTAGNACVVYIAHNASSTSTNTMADNIDGVTGWVRALNTPGGTGAKGVFWYKFSLPSGVTSLTCTAGAGATLITAIAHEVQNVSAFTGGESNATDFSTATTNPTTGTATNATASSIYFAGLTDGSVGALTMTINSTGSTGTWNLFDATNSQQATGSTALNASVPNQVVASGAARGHGWTTGNSNSATAAVFILH